MTNYYIMFKKKTEKNGKELCIYSYMKIFSKLKMFTLYTLTLYRVLPLMA